MGGSHQSVLGLLRQLDPDRYQAIIVPEFSDGHIARTFAGFDLVADPVPNAPRFVPGAPLGAREFLRTLGGVIPRARFLRRRRIDIVHVNDGRTSAQWALAARLAGARLVWHHRSDPRSLGLRIAAPLLADRVLTVSSFALPAPGMWSAASKAQVIHSPFDTSLRTDRSAARAALLNEMQMPPETVILGFFGAFVPRKRPLLFVDMVARARQMADVPVIGLMFGEARVPAMTDALHRRIADSGAPRAIRIMGYRSPGPFWIGGCDQLIVPAVGEPFGRTLIEAMLVGTPVIAARSGGNIEALREGLGILVAPDDAEALAAAATALIQEPACAHAMAAQAGDHARGYFSERRHGEQVMAVYEKLLSD